MTANPHTESPRTDARADRYRRAERVLWDYYGLKPSERFIALDDPAVQLRVVEIGEGDPVLFVPGSAGTGPVWAPLLAELKGFRCLLLDRPGWGLSSPIDYSAHDYQTATADLVARVLDGMGIARANVVGGSIGNTWVLRLAQQHPSRVDRVVVIGGFPYPGLKPHPILKLQRSPIGALMVRLPQRERLMRMQLRQIGHGPSLETGRIPDEFFTWRVGFGRYTDSFKHERDMVRAVLGRQGFRPGVALEPPELAQIERPVLMIWGTADPLGSVDVWKEQLTALPEAELSVVDGAGHLPWWDVPEQVGARIRDFLTR